MRINIANNRPNNFPLFLDTGNAQVLAFDKDILDIRLFFDIDKKFFDNITKENEIFDFNIVRTETNRSKQQIKTEFLKLSELQKKIEKIKNPIRFLRATTDFGNTTKQVNKISFSKNDMSKNTIVNDGKIIKFFIDFKQVNTTLLNDKNILKINISNFNNTLKKEVSLNFSDKLTGSKLLDSANTRDISVNALRKERQANIFDIAVKPVDPNITKVEIFGKSKNTNYKIMDANFDRSAGINELKKSLSVLPQTEEIRVVYYNDKLGNKTQDFIEFKLPQKENLLTNIKDDIITLKQNFDDANKNIVDINITNIDSKVKTYKITKKIEYPKQQINNFPDKIILYPTSDKLSYTDANGLRVGRIYKYLFEAFDIKNNLLLSEEQIIEIEENSFFKVKQEIKREVVSNSKNKFNLEIKASTENLKDVAAKLVFDKNTLATASAGISAGTDIQDSRLNRVFNQEEKDKIFINVVEEIDKNGRVVNTKKVFDTSKEIEISDEKNNLRVKTVSIPKDFLDESKAKFFHPDAKRGTLGIPLAESKLLEVKDPLLKNGVNKVEEIKTGVVQEKVNKPRGTINSFSVETKRGFTIITWTFDGPIKDVDKFIVNTGKVSINCLPDLTNKKPTHTANIKTEDIAGKSIEIVTLFFDKVSMRTLKNL